MRDIFIESNPDLTGLFETWENGYQVARVLQAGVELGIFIGLARSPATAEDLARRRQLDPHGTEVLCTALTAMGLLEYDGNVYRNTDAAEACLVPGQPLYRGEGIEHGADLYLRWAGLTEWVRTGNWPQGAPRPAAADADATRRFIMAMHSYSVAGRAQAVALAVDLSGARRMLDLGGGPGTYSIALCQRFPHLESTIRDLEGAKPFAQAIIADYGLEGRVRFEVGSWDDEVWGHDYDVVVLSNVLHGRTPLNQTKMARAYASLRAGGEFLVHDFILNPDDRGPLSAALFNINVAAYRYGELVEDLQAAGFTDVRNVPLSNSPQTLVSARKP